MEHMEKMTLKSVRNAINNVSHVMDLVIVHAYLVTLEDFYIINLAI